MEILWLLLGALLLWVAYKVVIRPYQLYSWYKKSIGTSKYKGLWWGFTPLAGNYMSRNGKFQKEKGDFYYGFKHMQALAPEPWDVGVWNFGTKVVLEIRSLELIKDLYVKDGTKSLFKYRELIQNFTRLTGDSIIFSEGATWKKKRKMMTSLLNFNYIVDHIPKIAQVCERELEKVSNGQKEFEVQVFELFQKITAQIIVELFFGGGQMKPTELEIDGKTLSAYSRELTDNIGAQMFSPLMLILGGSYAKLGLTQFDREVTRKLKRFKNCTSNFIRNRIYEIQEGRKSVVQDYVEKMYKSVEKESINDKFIEEINEDFSTLFLAGTETTTYSEMMLLYYIMLNPRVMKKLEEEIEQFVKKNEDINHENMKNMKYLDAVIAETNRFYQPGNGIILREAQEDFLLGELMVKKGTALVTDSLSNHYSQQYFENPHEFYPERWLDEDLNMKSAKPYSILTFSAGPRSCIGKQLAQMEMRIMTIVILKYYRINMKDTELRMQLTNSSYEPQKIQTKFIQK